MANMRSYFLVVIINAVMAGVASAAIYVGTVSDGTTVYSDTPATRNSQVYTLLSDSINSFTPPSAGADTTIASTSDNDQLTVTTKAAIVSQGSASSTANTQSPVVGNTNVTISSPGDQTTFQNQDAIPVSIKTDPPLQNGDKLQLIVDGAPYKQPQTSSTIMVEGLERGTHQIQARFTAANGAVNVSFPITIYKQQASVLLNAGKSNTPTANS